MARGLSCAIRMCSNCSSDFELTGISRTSRRADSRQLTCSPGASFPLTPC